MLKQRSDSDGNTETLDCDPDVAWRVKKDVSAFVMPQNCLGITHAIRVNIAIGAGDGTAGDPADWTRTVRVAYD